GGPRTPLLFVHGGLHGWWAWERWMGYFAAAGWRCYAMSLRNHTGSRAVATEAYLRLTVRDYADDVRTVAQWLDRPPVLVGHSMGGIVVQKAAVETRVAGLVLVGSVGPGQLGRIRDPLPADRPLMFDKAHCRDLWFSEIDELSLAAFHARLVPESPGVLNDYSGGGISIARDRITCPVLVIGGEFDATPVHRPREIAAFYTCPCLVVPNAAHNLMMESAALPVAMRLNEWLLAAVDGPALPPATGPSGPSGSSEAQPTTIPTA
ncbi:MAG: alpha/beta hydrolase, partial [Acetobacteraceae bacterium]